MQKEITHLTKRRYMYGCIQFLALNKLEFEHKERENSFVYFPFYLELFLNNAQKRFSK